MKTVTFWTHTTCFKEGMFSESRKQMPVVQSLHPK